MTDLFIKLFIKNHDDVKNPSVREKYGTLSGMVGIALNLLLCLGKFIIGSLSGSISITADAFNNLSDAFSSIVTLFGFKLSAKKPDKDHPFGHGRYEYISALIVAFLVLLMGFVLIKSAFQKILHPAEVTFSIPAVIVLVLSILGKLWLALFNRKLGKKIDSPAMTAVVTDSLGDIIATSAALFALILSEFTSIPIDGYIGIVVALFVLYAGYGILKDTVSPLLGEPPEKDIVNNLVDYVTSFDKIMGIHDLVVHNYGANYVFGSLHVEVSAEEDFVEMHDLIDRIEQLVLVKFGIHLVIHLDPLVFNDERVNSLREMTLDVIYEIDKELKLHDFRVVDGPTHTNIIFDLVVPYEFDKSEDFLIENISSMIKKKNPNIFVVMTIENSYI